MIPAALVWRDPSLRLVAGAILLFGAFAASLAVYQSLLAVEVFGLSDGAYAGVLAAAMAVSVAASVAVGVVTDRRPARRRVALLTAAVAAGGAALVWLRPTPAAFALAHAALMPVAGTIFGQVFALARLAAAAHPPAARDGILAVVRAFFAVPFVVVLPLWGLAFGAGLPLLAIYPAIAGVAAALLLLILRAWPPDGAAPWEEAPSGLGVRDSLREMAAAPVLARVALLGAIHVPPALNGILLGLLFADAGRGPGDAGLFFGAFVAVEIAATLALGALARRLPRLVVIAAGSVIYAAFLGPLPFLAASPWVWALILPAGVGGALVYTLTLAYLQDLLAERPGAGAALFALQRVSAEGLTAGIYGLGAWAQGYAAVAILGVGATLAATAAILRLDGVPLSRRRSPAPPPAAAGGP